MKGSKVNMSTKKTHEEFIAEAKNKNPYFGKKLAFLS